MTDPIDLYRRQRCVIYTRISRDDSRLGKANDRQEEECVRKAEFKRYDVVEVVRDISVSAYSGKERPGWQRVLEMVRNDEVDVILAYHFDRVTRSMRDLEDLVELSKETGVGVDFASGDIDLTGDVGRMVARILAAVARAEVERKSARQTLAYSQRAKEGKPHAVKTFGYKRGCMEVEPTEADAIVAAASDVLEGTTLAEILRRWQEAGYDCPQSTQGIRYILLNPRYVGIRLYHGEVVTTEAAWPAILDEGTHLALRALLEDPSRTSGTIRGRKPTTLLGGIAKCSVCEQPSKPTKAHGRLVYGCKGGNHVNTIRQDADDWVLAKLTHLLSQPDVHSRIAPSGDSEVDILKEQHEDLRKRKDDLAEMFAAGLMDKAQVIAGTAKIKEQMDAIEPLLTSRPQAASLRGLRLGTPQVVKEVLALPLERQRQLVDEFLTIRLVPRGKGNRRAEEVPIQAQVIVRTPSAPLLSVV